MKMRRTLDACPVQYEGVLDDGRRFYFRARYDGWCFGTGVDIDAAVASAMGDGEGFRCMGHWGDSDHAASWMPHDVAERLIAMCTRDYMAVAA